VPRATDLIVPGDISSAAFWMVAAAASPGQQITLKNVGLNPTRTGVINVLLRMGAHITNSESSSDGEPRGNVVIKGGELNATVIGGAEIPNVIDELPILAVAADTVGLNEGSDAVLKRLLGVGLQRGEIPINPRLRQTSPSKDQHESAEGLGPLKTAR
jgi:hypothetical protein